MISLTSNSLDQEITIDGSEAEWINNLQPVTEENLALGIMNDDEHLYIALVTADMRVRTKIMALGMTLWLDPAGGTEKALGIRFPLGIIDAGLPLNPMNMLQDPELVEQMFNESITELETIVQSKGQTIRWIRSEIPGMELVANSTAGTLVYEMKLPLQNDQLGYALDPSTAQKIGIGIETPRFQREELERARELPSATSQGGGYGQYGSGGSGFGGPQGEAGGSTPVDRNLLEVTAPTKFWATFLLATP